MLLGGDTANAQIYLLEKIFSEQYLNPSLNNLKYLFYSMY